MNIKSPLNYTGGKFKIINEIKSLFPKKIDSFYDVFCGGCNVLINVKAQNYIAIDNNKKLIDLLLFFKKTKKNDIKNTISNIVEQYNLTKSWENGYEFYGVNSNYGLAKVNKYNFLKLRTQYNISQNVSQLLVLLFYSFNNLFRFNLKGEYNVPVGKWDFNKNLQKNLDIFIEKIHKINPNFVNSSFTILQKFNFNENDFIYFDPPYLISTAEYNTTWSQENDLELMKVCDFLNKKKIKFAMSNILKHNNKSNIELEKWAKLNNYKINHIKNNYINSSYNKKNKQTQTIEVLITNY